MGCWRRQGCTEQTLGGQNPKPHGAGHTSEGCAQAGRSHLQGRGSSSQGPHGQGEGPHGQGAGPPGHAGKPQDHSAVGRQPSEQCASPISSPPEQDLPDQTAPTSLDHVPHRAQDAEEAESTCPTGQKSRRLASNQDVSQEGREKGPFNPQSGEESVI